MTDETYDENMEIAVHLYAMKIGDREQVGDHSIYLRVPGGWIVFGFKSWQDGVFVPFPSLTKSGSRLNL